MDRTRLSLSLVAVIVAAAIAVIVSTTGSSAKNGRTVPGNSAVSVEQTPFGRALVDAHGRTLYLFEGDKPNLSTLSAAGRAFWPPFTSSVRPSAIGGALVSRIAAVAGTGRPRQVTYNGHPLYYFVGDRNPGQTAGQGLNEFGARWYVLSPAGAAITSAHKASASSPSTGGASGSGY